jgi:hypothetical protein
MSDMAKLQRRDDVVIKVLQRRGDSGNLPLDEA